MARRPLVPFIAFSLVLMAASCSNDPVALQVLSYDRQAETVSNTLIVSFAMTSNELSFSNMLAKYNSGSGRPIAQLRGVVQEDRMIPEKKYYGLLHVRWNAATNATNYASGTNRTFYQSPFFNSQHLLTYRINTGAMTGPFDENGVAIE